MSRRLSVFLLALTSPLLPSNAAGQQDSTTTTTRVGLSAVGALTVHGSYASIQRGYRGPAVGATTDFGYIASRRLRLLADIGYLRTLPETEFVASENRSYRDVFRDLSGTLALALHLNEPTSRVTPYVAGGVGVHVLSSSFGSLAIDTRYNTNNFGALAAAGARLRTGATSRRAVQLEVRRVVASNVSRTSMHLGLAYLLGDLARR
jgi:hypothetical protein